MYNPFNNPYYTHQHYHRPTYDKRTQYYHQHTYIPYDPNTGYYPQDTYTAYDNRNKHHDKHKHDKHKHDKHHDHYKPYVPKEPKHIPAHYKEYMYLKRPTLNMIRPFVRYGLNEAKYTSYEHALTEVAAITYLIGQGYSPKNAHYIVEAWEHNEHF